ncbi:hypothetical protein OSB04_029377 [Centaurea solstitialis]|uniref:Reverse transcriptase Ty1/copia-type domain-containing protein n=1 Tax=Centaurea solstitialis TaxID=347529 RepID=A0AA38WC29_9ASTR|nr:hypothetical protein OSB04_029377 [Centaurea solstitialis]
MTPNERGCGYGTDLVVVVEGGADLVVVVEGGAELMEQFHWMNLHKRIKKLDVGYPVSKLEPAVLVPVPKYKEPVQPVSVYVRQQRQATVKPRELNSTHIDPEPQSIKKPNIKPYEAMTHLEHLSLEFQSLFKKALGVIPDIPFKITLPTPISHPNHMFTKQPLIITLFLGGDGCPTKNRTGDLVQLPPEKCKVGCKWARLVAKGNSQAYTIDYDETFSPVAKMPFVQNVKNVLLNGILEEEVYVEQPPGFIIKEEASKVCRLRRFLYGLKQSPRAWFGCFSDVLQQFGMT